MLLLVSGEGPSDIGTNAPGAQGIEFVPGPMTILLDRLIEQVLQYSLYCSAMPMAPSQPDAGSGRTSGIPC